jgi:hypothetical protein
MKALFSILTEIDLSSRCRDATSPKPRSVGRTAASAALRTAFEVLYAVERWHWRAA